MSSTVLCAVVLLACVFTFSAAQTSCKGRCGVEYNRGYTCQCDYNCLSYEECCKDFESQCTTKNSCKGRCGEGFKRGRLCSCDSDCAKFKQCCPDHKMHCDEEPSLNEATEPSTFSEGNNAGTTLPQPTTAADHVSRQPSPTSGPQTEYPPTADTPELQTVGKAEVQSEGDILPDDPTVASSDEPDVSTLPFNTASYKPVAPVSAGATQGSFTVLENSQVTISASTLDLTPNPEATISNTRPDDTEKNTDNVTTGPSSSLADLEDPSTSVSPAGPGDLPELEALTTHIPSFSESVQDDMTDEVTAGATTKPLNVIPDLTKPKTPESTLKPQDKPDPYSSLPVKPTPAKLTPAKPISKPETKPLDTAQTLNIDNSGNYQADDSNDTNLCSGRPVSAVTTLRNGTIVVFRGHYFWILDRHMVPGPARGITQVWGVPSPIDTVFTRCTCQGKTYIFKGSQYWRFENDVLDPYYPKVIETGFDGLRGHVTAALSVPQYRSRRESVYFFKRGGFVQKYSYQFGTSPTCGRKVKHAVYTAPNRMVRQAVSSLGQAVNIRTSWRGFPSTITAAVSIPSNREPEGYKYYVFSRSKSYNVRLDSERPVIATPAANASPQSNNIFKCQKTV